MRLQLIILGLYLSLSYCVVAQQGQVMTLKEVPFIDIPPRPVEVYLPPGYANGDQHYPVLYMHDGQNLFDTATAYSGIDWGVDEALDTLIAKGEVPPVIVVGIWNAGQRRRAEYMPEKPFYQYPKPLQDSLRQYFGHIPYADTYLSWIVNTLKPHIDALFRTKPGQQHTFMAGSSFGGLISLYAIVSYPQVFAGVAGVSTHWIIDYSGAYPTLPNTMMQWLGNHLPRPANHHLWMDHGTTTLDQYYGKYQKKMDRYMTKAGYTLNENWVTKVYPGAAHTERDWQKRVPEILLFLLNR